MLTRYSPRHPSLLYVCLKQSSGPVNVAGRSVGWDWSRTLTAGQLDARSRRPRRGVTKMGCPQGGSKVVLGGWRVQSLARGDGTWVR